MFDVRERGGVRSDSWTPADPIYLSPLHRRQQSPQLSDVIHDRVREVYEMYIMNFYFLKYLCTVQTLWSSCSSCYCLQNRPDQSYTRLCRYLREWRSSISQCLTVPGILNNSAFWYKWLELVLQQLWWLNYYQRSVVCLSLCVCVSVCVSVCTCVPVGQSLQTQPVRLSMESPTHRSHDSAWEQSGG